MQYNFKFFLQYKFKVINQKLNFVTLYKLIILNLSFTNS